ncbi:hypothetical protein [Paraburkholderia sp. DHOC27]|uniref:hypothetical protein n=1 Tax=Paraburkholderia sp. DHOC27 TaxID=2303330 RepID=UPI000E3C67E6|nr:hypothetical protein [Paraburkholderia sp. DHOC27]RFU49572.1 hypothetical protein D0B32_07235 [Paraburkholderia sp. DHOC27]
MLQVLVGVFASHRDGDEALAALQSLGLPAGVGHLYEEHKHDGLPPVAAQPEESDAGLHAEERAEYAAHGDYLNISGATNRYSAETLDDAIQRDAAESSSSTPGSDATARTLLVVEDIGGLRAATACAVLHDHGAVAVKDPSGHWHFSPRRNAAHHKV